MFTSINSTSLEAAVCRCSSKFHNFRKKTSGLECQVFSCIYCKILKNSFCYRTRLVAAFCINQIIFVSCASYTNLLESSQPVMFLKYLQFPKKTYFNTAANSLVCSVFKIAHLRGSCPEKSARV